MSRAVDYQRRVNRVINHISNNLGETHTIDELASIAHLSPFHFHRIFRAIAGETVNVAVSRLRLESAAATLIYQPMRSVTRIAVDHGFSSSANFAKSFTRHFGCSPTDFRNANPRAAPQNSKIGKAFTQQSVHNGGIEGERVFIREEPTLSLAYLRRTGGFDQPEISRMHEKVWQWAEQHNCLVTPPVSVGITWSDSHVVEQSRWIYDACVAVQPGTTGEELIDVQTLVGGRVAQYEVQLASTDKIDLTPYWDWFVGHWLVSAGYELRLSPSYEIYLQTEPNFIVRLCLPLQSNGTDYETEKI